ncbi:hypothetical protein N9H39_02560 [Gammaproteobacteria bacterium]|nr:hypothetical protein [Gammaproteobacteria bacterium]
MNTPENQMSQLTAESTTYLDNFFKRLTKTLSRLFLIEPIPQVGGCDEDHGYQGDADLEVEIYGSNFYKPAEVSISGGDVTITVDQRKVRDNSIIVSITIEDGAAATKRDVTVTCNGVTGTAADDAFTVRPG